MTTEGQATHSERETVRREIVEPGGGWSHRLETGEAAEGAST